MKIAVITGASSGIGREAAIQIAKKYQDIEELWLVARRAERLYRIADVIQRHYAVNVRAIPLDLQEPGWEQELSGHLEDLQPEVSILFSSAGYGRNGSFAEDALENQSGMVRLNCEALTTMTHLLLPRMTEGSQIILVASSAAFSPQPGFAVYAATKAYVLSFARALSVELKPRKISVTAVCPGPVDTEFFQRFSNEKNEKKLVDAKKKFMVSPAKVVRLALKDAKKGKVESIYGIPMKFAQLACKVLPWTVVANIMKSINEDKKDETKKAASEDESKK
ncbi:MAG: SDR family NAD(P)-dependent oxidoreductase [Lachnospiraceae bacterium]